MPRIRQRYAFGDKICYADDLARDRMGRQAVYKDMIVRQLTALNLTDLIEKAVSKPTGEKVFAVVNHSRWIAMCEHCGGAQAVNPNEGFFCTTCLNIKNKNRPRPVVFPENAKEIVAELEKREKPMNRNWFVNETVDSLKAEVR